FYKYPRVPFSPASNRICDIYFLFGPDELSAAISPMSSLVYGPSLVRSLIGMLVRRLAMLLFYILYTPSYGNESVFLFYLLFTLFAVPRFLKDWRLLSCQALM